jgi:hypothetical protein
MIEIELSQEDIDILVQKLQNTTPMLEFLATLITENSEIILVTGD